LAIFLFLLGAYYFHNKNVVCCQIKELIGLHLISLIPTVKTSPFPLIPNKCKFNTGEKQSKLCPLITWLRFFLPRTSCITVDAFQAREEEIVILVTTKKMPENLNDYRTSLAFINNPQRVAVAISRSRQAFCLIGDFETLRKCVSWRKFIDIASKFTHIINNSFLFSQTTPHGTQPTPTAGLAPKPNNLLFLNSKINNNSNTNNNPNLPKNQQCHHQNDHTCLLPLPIQICDNTINHLN